MKKKNKKIILFFLVFIIVIALGTINSKASDLELNDLDFYAQINDDGSIDVTETWNIDIYDTNTLYKTFKTDDNKYSKITDVVVKNIVNGQSMILTKTNTWAYHVTKNYYYGTNNEDGNFEIGWGVGLDNSSATRKYQISYTVEDVIKKCNDYAELYWQFLGSDFKIDADKITGTIKLPEEAISKETIRVWGHTQDLNGTIYATSNDTIEFKINDYRSGNYVEIRTLFPTQLIENSGRTENINILDSVLEEEKVWTEEANARRERQQMIEKIITIGIVILNILGIIIYAYKEVKYIKKNKSIEKLKPTQELEYYRDLPDEKATPGEAVYLMEKSIAIEDFNSVQAGRIFSATMLDLALKGFITIESMANEKDNFTIHIVEKEPDELKIDEKAIYKYIIKIAKDKDITLKQFRKEITKNPSETEQLIKNSYTHVKLQLEKSQMIDKERTLECNKYSNYGTSYLAVAFFLTIFTMFTFVPFSIVLIIDGILCKKIAKKIGIYTKKGINQKEEWKGLKKYMEDFSLLKEREVPELVIWERFLVYATAFGIADKVIKQLKTVYKFSETDGAATFASYHYINLMIGTNFTSAFTNSISSSMSSTYSSATGGGGGFSGGGGGGRWRRRWRWKIIYLLQI